MWNNSPENCAIFLIDFVDFLVNNMAEMYLENFVWTKFSDLQNKNQC